MQEIGRKKHRLRTSIPPIKVKDFDFFGKLSSNTEER